MCVTVMAVVSVVDITSNCFCLRKRVWCAQGSWLSVKVKHEVHMCLTLF